MKKISYASLQKKYAGQVVVLDKKETKVLAAGRHLGQIEKQLRERNVKLTDGVLVGPIQKVGAINVYFRISLSKKTN